MSGVFFTVVCPLLGTLICNGMWLAPLPAVRDMHEKQDMGELNPLPWVAAYLNCIAYTTYGILRKDFYIFFSNITGLCLAASYALVSITVMAKSANKRDIDRMYIIVGALVFGMFFYSVLGMAAGMAYTHSSNERNLAATMFGLTGCAFSISYYTAPLSTAVQVIRTKDASSFYAPMIILNFTNAMLWLFYGFAIGQLAVWAPNAVGAALSIFQLSLIFLYRNTTKSKDHAALDDSTSASGVEVKPVKQLAADQQETASPMWKEGQAQGNV